MYLVWGARRLIFLRLFSTKATPVAVFVCAIGPKVADSWSTIVGWGTSVVCGIRDIHSRLGNDRKWPVVLLQQFSTCWVSTVRERQLCTVAVIPGPSSDRRLRPTPAIQLKSLNDNLAVEAGRSHPVKNMSMPGDASIDCRFKEC